MIVDLVWKVAWLGAFHEMTRKVLERITSSTMTTQACPLPLVVFFVLSDLHHVGLHRCCSCNGCIWFYWFASVIIITSSSSRSNSRRCRSSSRCCYHQRSYHHCVTMFLIAGQGASRPGRRRMYVGRDSSPSAL